jgi:hypothetical protein
LFQETARIYGILNSIKLGKGILMVFEYLVIAIFIGIARKGSVKKLSDTNIKLWYLFIASFLLQGISMYFYHRSSFIDSTYPLLIIGSYLMIMYAIWSNRSLNGFIFFGLGTFLNFLVISVNGGRMPVSTEALESIGLSEYIPKLIEGVTKHQIITDETHLSFLADVIPIQPPLAFSSSVISVGDIFITLGVAWFIYKGMVREKVSN